MPWSAGKYIQEPSFDDGQSSVPKTGQSSCDGHSGASESPHCVGQDRTSSHPRLAVAKDEAFCFYYQDNLDLLESMGAEIVPFSPLHDAALPKEIDGLLLGGGYPELHARALSQNETMKASIRQAIEGGMPYLAECGGFMYLHTTMEDMEGHPWPMCGCIPGQSFHTPKLSRFGYITLQTDTEEEQLLGRGQEIRGHEFHYFDSTALGEDYQAKKPTGKRQWACIHGTRQSAAGYPHLYYWSNPEFAYRFVQKMREARIQ
jgi:cobyrinic acid a,c-diamide synthase